jgi:hypothetical protein
MKIDLQKTVICSVLILTFQLFFISNQLIAMNFCTASDAKYFTRLLNLIGSLHHTNFENTQEIAVFDLGLTDDQMEILSNIEKVKLYSVELTHPDLLTQFEVESGKMVPGWYAWKFVILKQALDIFSYTLWIDAGSTVMRPLDDLFKHINQNGYFLATTGIAHYPIYRSATRYVKEKFNLYLPENQWILSQDVVMGGIIGVSHKCLYNFVLPAYELAYDIRNFIDDGTAPGGFGTARHDQPLLSILAYSNNLKVFKQDFWQKVPMLLTVENESVPFYITSGSIAICTKAHICSSRGDLRGFDFYYQCIRFKKGEL